MIELVFDGSALGSLKTAHIGEDTSDAYGVHLALSIGDISEDRPGV
jgi:hypothetical protein